MLDREGTYFCVPLEIYEVRYEDVDEEQSYIWTFLCISPSGHRLCQLHAVYEQPG